MSISLINRFIHFWHLLNPILWIQPNYMIQIRIPVYDISTPPQPLVIEIFYNQSHTVQLIFTPSFTQQHHPPHYPKDPPPSFLTRNCNRKTTSLSTTTYILCRLTTSGHEPYSFHNSPPIQKYSNDPPYKYKLWSPPPNQGLGLSLPSTVSLKYKLIYSVKNINSKIYRNELPFQMFHIIHKQDTHR